MTAESPLSAIAHVIQLAITPVFLLLCLGTFLNMISTRLGRIVDRARTIEERAPNTVRTTDREELRILRRRRTVVNFAIACGTFGSLVVCVLIGSAFVAAIIGVDPSWLVATLFIITMISFTGVLVAFLAEVRLSMLQSPYPQEPQITKSV